jgi:DNA polymerase-2
MGESKGFVVSAWQGGSRLFFAGRLGDGRSFACVEDRGEAAILVRGEARDPALRALEALCPSGCEDWTDKEGRPLARIVVAPNESRRGELLLARARVEVVANERAGPEDFLLARSIRGPVIIRGEERPGRLVDVVFVRPDLTPADAHVPLRWLALDIETDREEHIVAASLVSPALGQTEGDRTAAREGFLVGPDTGLDSVSSFPDEASLLAALADRLRAIDPDVITGWNVVDFDLRVLAGRFAANRLPFLLGRSDEPARLVERAGRRLVVACPGRAVLDAMRLVRGSGERFDDLRLETVSRNVLGEGKSVTSEGEDKLGELEELRARDPAAFVSYGVRDSELVMRILAKTGLDRLTQERAALTGLPLDLAWTSIPAFERVYAAGLRLRRVAAPRREDRRVSGAAGGTVLDPFAGFHEGVLVFDFRSLYPSLMRTFNIDPLAHARAMARATAPGDITAPNGARFERAEGILPSIIARYASEREIALKAGDATAAHVYKILQNSFYGVLGAEGCLYARTELAGAVTSFGRKYLVAARDFFESRGYRTLYGDTDSVFVESGLGAGAGFAELAALGESLAGSLNAELAASIGREFARDSFLRIRCEKIYRRFFIPRLRIDPEPGARRGRAFLGGVGEEEAASGAIKGRAKGYAGLRLDADGSCRVEVKGMEAARSDWTPLARRFQVELLALAFGLGPKTGGAGPNGGSSGLADPESVAAYCRSVAEALRRGELDDELVYRKMLRRPPEEYASASPQVRAALILGWSGRRGAVSFVMTVAGPEPVSRRSGASLDYTHYAEHQLLPIARAVAEALADRVAANHGEAGRAWDVERWFADRPQMELAF